MPSSQDYPTTQISGMKRYTMTVNKGPANEMLSRANRSQVGRGARSRIKSTALFAVLALSTFAFLFAGYPVHAQLS
ncbi:MAG TPA: hypothetical protein VJX74_08750, partial [Blastocatellia bacterium]|nr:hypothetical protein [Blastocatellia bacterium]